MEQDGTKELHERVKNKEFNMLSPFTDDKGLIRVGGRVDKAIVTYDSKHPVLLPKNNHILYLITKDVHQITHTGVASTATYENKKKILDYPSAKIGRVNQEKVHLL
jgi:hypothetical protein